MMRALFAGVSGLRNHQVRMDVIGNNIANVNTVAFKSSRVTFAPFACKNIGPGSFDAANNSRARSSPYRASQRAASHSGNEYAAAKWTARFSAGSGNTSRASSTD